MFFVAVKNFLKSNSVRSQCKLYGRLGRQRQISYSVNKSTGRLYFILDDEVTDSDEKVTILSPLTSEEISSASVLANKSALSVAQVIDERYSENHFVGGMGESDPGVWFTCINGDETLVS